MRPHQRVSTKLKKSFKKDLVIRRSTTSGISSSVKSLSRYVPLSLAQELLATQGWSHRLRYVVYMIKSGFSRGEDTIICIFTRNHEGQQVCSVFFVPEATQHDPMRRSITKFLLSTQTRGGERFHGLGPGLIPESNSSVMLSW